MPDLAAREIHHQISSRSQTSKDMSTHLGLVMPRYVLQSSAPRTVCSMLIWAVALSSSESRGPATVVHAAIGRSSRSGPDSETSSCKVFAERGNANLNDKELAVHRALAQMFLGMSDREIAKCAE
jgi:hypothetical protein